MLQAGVRNIAAWAYRGAHPIDLGCEAPEEVWDAVGEAFRSARALAESGA